ncbi:DUF305 domain-containing protein [Micromonospora chaiyaphumensis]|uniref:Uncharacterized conserved protein, DUF305 family n=1 Tax=Micromonospora chaiyaphumensis TaxID=307119 RepID=A0A1C4UDI2_9ACTN|nr:DUF305 domain-containing protein [Micromonospora chaiyaphumensis]SCE69745.1 Uncharacterized conserved protein, DUF305 family [Micromonospora chaiyaphumensis]
MTGRQGRVWLAVTALVALAVMVGVVLAGWGGSRPAAAPAGPSATATPPVDAPPVVVPGRPGEPAATRAAQEVRDGAPPRYNGLDVWYVRMMIPHHQQAVEMASLAPDRAADPRVRAVADRIRAAQGPEIGVLRGWLGARDLPAEVAGHDHGTMRGMQSAEAVRQLAAARGADFDRLFVRMMTAHHEGAVIMSTDLLKVGADQTLQEFANAVAVEQSAEIARLRDLIGA